MVYGLSCCGWWCGVFVNILSKRVVYDVVMMVAGVGMLQFNTQLHAEDVARMSLWNARKFYGFSTVVSTLLSGASANSGCGY